MFRFGSAAAIAWVLFLGCALQASANESLDVRAVMPEQHRKVLKKYCFDCHDSDAEEGGVNLETIPMLVSKDIETAEKWQKILNAINTGEMPPEDSESMSDHDKTVFLDDLSNQMVVARKILGDTGGVITIRRLNRREYQNTVEALIGVIPDVSSLPDDQATAGFDTAGASLFISSDQLELYLATARRALELALLPRKSPKYETVRVEPEKELTPYYAATVEQMKDIEKRANAFLSQSEKPASEFGLLDEYQAKRQRVQKWLPQFEQYLARPETKTGATLIMTIKQGGPTKVKLPTLGEHSEGKYIVRVRAAAYPGVAERFHYLEFTSGFGSGRKLLGWRKVTGTIAEPQVIEFPIEHPAGEKANIWIHQRTHQDRGDKNLASIDNRKNGIGTPPGLWVDWAELEGPLPGSRRTEIASKILFETPKGRSEEQHAREVLNRFALRAFRGEDPNQDFLDRLVQQYLANRSRGQKKTEAFIGPLSIILSSPSFIYLVESAGSGGSSMLTDNELAVRLSYLLWEFSSR